MHRAFDGFIPFDMYSASHCKISEADVTFHSHGNVLPTGCVCFFKSTLFGGVERALFFFKSMLASVSRL